MVRNSCREDDSNPNLPSRRPGARSIIRLKTVRSEEDAEEAIDDLRELLELEDLLVQPSLKYFD